jgi:acetoacetyl-CoA synthetase
MEKFLWEPSGKRKKESLLEDFSKYINIKSNYNFKTLWKWSVDHPEEFWSKFWDYSKIIGDKGKEIIRFNKIFNKTKFFPDSKLNYTENILKKKSSDPAISFYLRKDLKRRFLGNNFTLKFVKFSRLLKVYRFKKRRSCCSLCS